MLTIDNFDTQFAKTEIQKGRHYFDRKAVLYAEKDSKGVWQAEVEGTETYSVSIELDKKEVADTQCDCPVEGPYCKHVIAVLFAIREELKKPTPKPGREPKKLTIEGLLAKLTADEMRAFLNQVATSDKAFASRLQLHFSDKDERIDLAKQYSDLLKRAIRDNSDRGFVDYRNTFKLAKEVDKVVGAGKELLTKGNFRDAITVGKVVATEMMEVVKACDDSAGNISGTVWGGMNLLHEAAKSPDMAPPLRESLYEWVSENLINKTFANYGDSDLNLLSVAKTLANQLTEPDRFLSLLDTLTTRYTDKYDSFYREYFAKLKIDFLLQLGRNTEADQLTEANLDIVAVREKVLDKALANQQWDYAGELIQGGINIAQKLGHPGTVSRWEKRFLDVAKLRNDIPTIRQLTKQFTFDRHQFDAGYYQQLKQTFSADKWPGEFALLVQSIKQEIEQESKPGNRRFNAADERYRRLVPLYSAEKQWPEVLKLLQNSLTYDHIEQLHPHLAALYPAEMLALYTPILTKWGDQVSTRPEYKELATAIKKVKKEIAGSDASMDELVNTLRANNAKKPAFLDELNRIYQEPKKQKK